MQIDLAVSQLLCSRICHDLVGVSGAVNAGIELMGEGEDDGGALALTEKSAAQIARRLAFFRVAFGFGGGDQTDIGKDEVKALAEGWLDDGKIALEWTGDSADGSSLSGACARVLLNIVLMAGETLPGGGTIGVQLAALSEGTGIAVTARGNGARLRDDLAQALAAGVTPDQLNARNVHGYFAQCLAAAAGGRIEVETDDGCEVRFATIVE